MVNKQRPIFTKVTTIIISYNIPIASEYWAPGLDNNVLSVYMQSLTTVRRAKKSSSE